MMFVNSSQNYNVTVLIFVIYLFGVDYLPFNQANTEFEKNNKIRWNFEKSVYKKMLKNGNIVRINILDTDSTLLQKQQLCVI